LLDSKNNPDLAILDASGGSGVLALHPTGLVALRQQASLVEHQHRLLIAQVFDYLGAQIIAYQIGLPVRSRQKVLHPSGVRSRAASSHSTARFPGQGNFVESVWVAEPLSILLLRHSEELMQFHLLGIFMPCIDIVIDLLTTGFPREISVEEGLMLRLLSRHRSFFRARPALSICQ